MSTRKIWLVWGMTGEYEDYHDWVVCAYKSEKKARLHVTAAMERAVSYDYNYKCNCKAQHRNFAEHMGKLDSRGSLDYTGIVYNVTEVKYVE